MNPGLVVTDHYQVRPGTSGAFDIYKNDNLLISNLDSSDVTSFCADQKALGRLVSSETKASFDNKKPFNIHGASNARSPGRSLILAPHLPMIKNMVEENPATTARDIEKRLRSLGVEFAALSAVTNLARKHGIKLQK